MYALVHETETYPTHPSGEEWGYLKIRLPASKLPDRQRAHPLRDIFDATFYVLRSVSIRLT